MSHPHTYTSFRYSRHGKWKWPHRSEVHELMRHPQGIIILSCFLILNYSFASWVVDVPVAAGSDVFSQDWFQEVGTSQRLNRKYRGMVPSMMRAYLKARGEFATALATHTATAEAAASWQTATRDAKEKLLAMTIPASLKEAHLGLVVAIGLDEAAAGELVAALSQGGARGTQAEQAFTSAEDRLMMVLQSATWLVQE